MITVKKDFSPIILRLETEQDLIDIIDLLEGFKHNEEAITVLENDLVCCENNTFNYELCNTLLKRLKL